MKNNKFKRILARVNRGLVLGLVLGIALVVFVVVDAVRFNMQTADIREDIVSYVSALVQLNGKLEATPAGGIIADSDREKMRSGLEEIFGQYCADPALADKITVYEGYDTREVAEELEVWFGKTAGFKLISSEINADSDKFTLDFQRQGYSYAYVQLNNLPLTVKVEECGRNTTDIFLGRGPAYLIDQKYYDDGEAWVNTRERTVYLSGTLYLTLVEDEWRILMSDFYTKKEPEIR